MTNNQFLATYAIDKAIAKISQTGRIDIHIKHKGGEMILLGNMKRKNFRILPLMKKANARLRRRCWEIVAYAELFGGSYPEQHKKEIETKQSILN